ncbi:MAG: DUF2304 domain-containing protein [Acidimicrobiia bacterium]
MTLRTHVLVLAVTIIAFLFIFRLVRHRQLRSKYALLWLVIGVALLPLAAFPAVLETVSDWFGVAYAPTTYLFLATGFLFLVAVQFSWELSRLELRVRTISEEVALLRAELEARTGDGGSRPPSLTSR